MTLSIVVPTIPGRDSELERTVEAYERLTSIPIEWVIETGHSTCAAGWNAGMRRASGEVVHMAADDVEPESDRWLPAALRVLARGCVPLGWVREGDRRFGRDYCRIVVCRRGWWVDVPETHYYSDDAFTYLMIQADHLPVVAPGFDFWHRRSLVGRDDSEERCARDRVAAMRGVGVG